MYKFYENIFWGQTECSALSNITLPGEFIGGHVGGPSVSAVIKLADVPEMNYFAVFFKDIFIVFRNPATDYLGRSNHFLFDRL